MKKYIIKRLLWMIVVLLGVLFIVFVLLEFTPGDPARQILGVYADEEEVAAKRLELRLDDPFLVRFGRYVYNLVFRFDLGISYRTKLPVMQEIATRFPITIAIGVLGLVVSVAIGLVAGIISAVKQYSWLDKICNVFAVIFHAMPNFWLALELSLIFALYLKWLPPTGYKGLKYLILPVAVLGLNGSTAIFRQVRSSMLDVIREDYIRTARAKGQSEIKIILKHELRNALMPVVTMIGNSLGAIIAGSVVVESIFSIPGLGNYMLQAINSRDYPVIQGSVFVLAFMICIFNLLTDIVYSFLDPQLQSQYQSNVKSKKRGVKA